MLNKKILSGVTLSMAVCLSACSAGGTEVTETVSEAATEAVTTAAETTTTAGETTTVTTTETTTEVTTEAVDTSGVEYIKEVLQADWDDRTTSVSMYTADLNGDGVEELFIGCLWDAGQHGMTYIYDVSGGIEKLCDMFLSLEFSKGELYTDNDGAVHFISYEQYANFGHGYDTSYFDVSYGDSGAFVKIPFFVEEYGWFDNGAHMFEYDIYTDCEFISPAVDERNFDREKAEYVGRFDWDLISGVFNKGESNEVSEIIQKEVFDGLTYVSDIEEIYDGSTFHEDFEDFDSFWQQAAPKLAETYSK